MKVRAKFVSNSSSSSFTCEVCGNTESGMDMGPEDFDMYSLPNGVICQSEFEQFIEARNLQEELDKFEEENGDYYDLPNSLCPFYNLYYVKDDQVLSYLAKIAGRTVKDLKDELRIRFKNLDELNTFLKEDAKKSD